jgi:hypothetical protein
LPVTDTAIPDCEEALPVTDTAGPDCEEALPSGVMAASVAH